MQVFFDGRQPRVHVKRRRTARIHVPARATDTKFFNLGAQCFILREVKQRTVAAELAELASVFTRSRIATEDGRPVSVETKANLVLEC